MAPFNTVAVLARLTSTEAEPVDGSVIVTAAPDTFLADLIKALIRPN